jgi:hypothetical protein
MNLKPILDFLKKNSPYVVLALAIVFNLGALPMLHWWTQDNQTWAMIDSALLFLGISSIRASIAAAAANADLSGITGWLAGYKTHIVAVIGAVFSFATAEHWITPDMPLIVFVNSVLGIFDLGFLKAGIQSTAKALLLTPPPKGLQQ